MDDLQPFDAEKYVYGLFTDLIEQAGMIIKDTIEVKIIA